MKIIEYAKSHPWQTGLIVIVGGIIFYMIAFSGGGSSTTTTVDSGPSDAEVMAQAQVQAAQIGAQAATAQATIGGSLQLESDKLAAEIARDQIASDRELGLTNINTNRDISLASFSSQAAQAQAAYAAQAAQAASAAAVRTAEIQSQNKLAEGFFGTQTAGIFAERDVNLAAISANENVLINNSNNTLAAYQTATEAQAARVSGVLANLGGVAKKDKDDVLISIGTGIPWESGGGSGGLPAILNGTANLASSLGSAGFHF